MATSKRRSVVVTGAAFTVAGLALGAAAFASSKVDRGVLATHSIAPRSFAVTKVGTSIATVAPNSSRDVQVLDAGVVTLLLDSTAGTFKVTKVVVELGWEAATSVPDGTHASVEFTSATRNVTVTMVLDAGVLTVTITDVPATSSSSTSTSSSVPSSTSSAATTVATTAPSTSAETTEPSVDPTVETSVVAATCEEHEDDEDDDEGEHEDCDDDEDEGEDEHATTQTSRGGEHHEDDDDDDDDHGRGRGEDHDDD